MIIISEATREEIRQFCETRWGKVVDVAMCYNDTGVAQRYRSKGELMKKMESDLARGKAVSKLERKLDQLDKKIEELKTKMEKRLVCAYVTYNFCEDQEACLRDFPSGWYLSKNL